VNFVICPLAFFVPSALYTGMEMGRLNVGILFSRTNSSSIAEVLHPESRRARTGTIEASPRRILALISREFGDRFLVTNLGFFCSSRNERLTSSRESWRIC